MELIVGHNTEAVSSAQWRAAERSWGELMERRDVDLPAINLPQDDLIPVAAEQLARKYRRRLQHLVLIGDPAPAAAASLTASMLGLGVPRNGRRGKGKGAEAMTLSIFTLHDVSHGAMPPLGETLFCAIGGARVSDSTLSALTIVDSRIRRELGDDRVRDHLILICDSERGPLREYADSNQLPSLTLDPGIPVDLAPLSALGLFPLACVGGTPADILEGALAADAEMMEARIQENPAARIAIAMCTSPAGSPEILGFAGRFDWTNWWRLSGHRKAAFAALPLPNSEHLVPDNGLPGIDAVESLRGKNASDIAARDLPPNVLGIRAQNHSPREAGRIIQTLVTARSLADVMGTQTWA
ncbi:hypothetical protein KQI84_16685 [bacterium]|nr:hypothetical protein [bacterium]